ncbi:MAG: hypothetical protein ACFFFO_03145 [Candidatus Thorarchaeota archaeon]
MQNVLLVDAFGLLGSLALILLLILMIWGIIVGTGRSRNLSIVGFLVSLFVIVGWIVTTITRMGIIPIIDWIRWGRHVEFGMRGLWLFMIFVYMFIWAFPDLLSERKWILVAALILPLIYELMMFIAFSSVPSVFIETFLALEVITVVIYLGIIPLYAAFRYTRQERVQGTPRVPWIWLTEIGVLIWFVGEFILGIGMLFQLPGYDSFISDLSVVTISTHAIGWLVMFLGFIFQRRAIQVSAT